MTEETKDVKPEEAKAEEIQAEAAAPEQAAENTEEKEVKVAESEAPKKKGPKVTPSSKKPNLSRKTLRALYRRKKKKLILEDKEFAKNFFDAKSKRSAAGKVAYRKRHATK